MMGYRVAQRYAKGLMIFAKEANQTDVVYNEMKSLSKIIKNSSELALFLGSPIIDVEKKNKTLLEIFAQFSKTSKNFISLIVKKRRENIIDKIAQQYVSIYDQEYDILTVEIISAVELDEKEIDNILSRIKKNATRKLNLNVVQKIDPSLIGGFILNIDNYQFDSSIKSKISKLKKEFYKNDYIPKY